MRRLLITVAALVVATGFASPTAHAAGGTLVEEDCVASLAPSPPSSAMCWRVFRVKREYRVTASAIERNLCSIGAKHLKRSRYRSLRVARASAVRLMRQAEKAAHRQLASCSPWKSAPPPLPFEPTPPPSPAQTMCVDGMPFVSWDAFTGEAKLMDAWGGCYRPGVDPEPTRPTDPANNPLGWVRNSDGSITRPLDPAESGGIVSQTCVLGGKGMACSPDHVD